MEIAPYDPVDLDAECRIIARYLLDNEISNPRDWLKEAVQTKIAAQPYLSDLIFKYLCNAMWVDNPNGDMESPSVEETATALSILSNLFDISPEHIARHYLTRL